MLGPFQEQFESRAITFDDELDRAVAEITGEAVNLQALRFIGSGGTVEDSLNSASHEQAKSRQVLFAQLAYSPASSRAKPASSRTLTPSSCALRSFDPGLRPPQLIDLTAH